MNSIYEPYVGSAEYREAMDYGKHSSGFAEWNSRGRAGWNPSYVGRHRAESTGAGA
ncbi:hypothetical protein [Mycobacteroides abscessus]|uniref:hypothetical protein n=1 Tax=Mycobacteroides abscessus TaxID=36809 RepID=UPI0002E77D2A|nr:hypothetical protein [Mycobacteroides abscessus]